MHQNDCEPFETNGLVKLPGLLPDRLTFRARNLVYEKLEQAGLRRNNAWQIENLAHGNARRQSKRLFTTT